MSDKLNVIGFTRTRGTWAVLVILAGAWIATSVWAFRVADTSAVFGSGTWAKDISGNLSGSKNGLNIADTGAGTSEPENNVVDEARQNAELRLLDAFEEQDKKAAEAARQLVNRQRVAEAAKRLAEQQAAEEAQRLAEQQAAEEAQRLAEQQAAEEAQRLAEQQAAEEAQRLAEQQAAEEAQRLAEQQAAEEAQRLAEKQAAEEVQRLAEQQISEEQEPALEVSLPGQGGEKVSLTELGGKEVSLIGLRGEKEHLRRVSVGDWYQRQQQKISDQRRLLAAERQRSRDLNFLDALSGLLRFENRNEVVDTDIEQVLERMLDPFTRYDESKAVVTVSSNEFKGLADNHRLSLERGRAIVNYFEHHNVQANRFTVEVVQAAGLPYGTHQVRVSIEELENDR